MKYLIGKVWFPRDENGEISGQGKYPEGVTDRDWKMHRELLEQLRPDKEENPTSITEWEDHGEYGYLYLYTGRGKDKEDIINLISKVKRGTIIETEENTGWEIDPDPNSMTRIIAREFSRWRRSLKDEAEFLEETFNKKIGYIKRTLDSSGSFVF